MQSPNSNALLHLVDDDGQPVRLDIRVAVQGAYRYASRRFPRIDGAVLASMTESVATAMSLRCDQYQIQSVNQYALAALIGKIHEWYRAHPLSETSVASEEALERAAGGQTDRSFGDVENQVFLSQMKIHLSERERLMLVLIEQDLGNPQAIASAFGLSYDAAKKALQRLKEKMSTLVNGNKNTSRLRLHHPYGKAGTGAPKMKTEVESV